MLSYHILSEVERVCKSMHQPFQVKTKLYEPENNLGSDLDHMHTHER